SPPPAPTPSWPARRSSTRRITRPRSPPCARRSGEDARRHAQGDRVRVPAAMRKVIAWPDGTKKKSRRQEGGTGINVVGDARGKTPWIGACRRESPPGSSQTSHRQVPRQRG